MNKASGGHSRSESKQAASRANGKLGGRPIGSVRSEATLLAQKLGCSRQWAHELLKRKARK